MGAWGAGVFENDAALDVKNHWEDEVAPRLGSLSTESIVAEFAADWGEPIPYFDSSLNAELMALAQLLVDAARPLPAAFKRAVEQAASWELKRDVLAEWESPKERRRVLIAFLDGIGGEKRKLEPLSKLMESMEQRLVKSLASFRGDLILLLSDSQRPVPPLLPKLNALLVSGIATSPEHARAVDWLRQRLMTLAFWATTDAGFPKEQTQALMQEATEAERGRVPDHLAGPLSEGRIDERIPPHWLERSTPEFASVHEAFEILSKLIDCWGKGPVSYIEAHYPDWLIAVENELVRDGYRGDDEYRNAENRSRNKMMMTYLVGLYCGWTRERCHDVLARI